MPGRVVHTMGWPQDPSTFGGGWIYDLKDNCVSIGFVTGLDYDNPYTDPHDLMQRWKSLCDANDLILLAPKSAEAAHWQRTEAPDGYYNLGLAHGVPGVIALLGAACATGVAAGTARPLLDGAVAWLLAQRLPDGFVSQFSYWAGPGIKAEPSRLAWCYGDLGLAAALLYAARCVGETGWEREALAIPIPQIFRVRHPSASV